MRQRRGLAYAATAGGFWVERMEPGALPEVAADAESPDVWGFADTAFRVLSNGSVVLTGSRYPLCGAELADLLPWMQEQIGIELRPADTRESGYPTRIPEARENPALLRALRELLPEEAISTAPELRLRHGHGHTLDEMWAIKFGAISRVPDLVVFPQREEDVEALVAAAARHGACLIPYGGGTNVTNALACPERETRSIISVDMRRLGRILWIDPANQMACIQAGAVGRHIAAQLAEHGFTLGHEPDSIEFSTLGGWIATHASGMKKNRYGNIEDLVLDMNVVTAQGAFSRSAVTPRESVGSDARRWLFGSEGGLGIVTRAVVKIFPLPEVQRYDAILFPDFARGLAFLHDLTRQSTPAASVRLMDNLQFQLGQALKPRAAGFRALLRAAQRFYVTRLRGFDAQRMAACTLLFEGGRGEVRRQRRAALRIARQHGGMGAGEENGRRGYQLTFGIAYIRDFVMRHHILAESFETSAPWSEALSICEGVKRRIRAEYRARQLPGRPFITCRITQLYHTGVCIYFYFAFHCKGVANADAVFAELERAARDEILRRGGSLSHHHGVGKIRQRFLGRVLEPAALAWAADLKRAVDPGNVFAAGNFAAHAERPPGPQPEPDRTQARAGRVE